MIDCAECVAYANLIHTRGEINVDEIEKLALDRHILKGCDKLPYTAPTLTLLDHRTLTMDVVCNGFSIKKTILEALREANSGYCDDLQTAEIITDALLIKMRIKQGEE